MMLVICLTFIQTDVNEIEDKYQITSDSFKYEDSYHLGIGTLTAITCYYHKEEELDGLQYAN